jgi:signal recognition particle subunit SEC65
MSITITNHTLEKIEQLLQDLGYKVRYEKGNFKTGSCLIEKSKIVVVNKFSNLESKIGALVELIKTIEFEEALLNEKQKTFYYSLQQTKLQL